MKLSLRWLNDHVDLSGIDPADIAAQLTMKVAAIERMERAGAELGDVKVAWVKRAERHPDADRLSRCLVDTGAEELEVVCGAPNVATGQKIAYAPVGGVLPGGFRLERRKIRGIVSHGMICSEKELGLGEDQGGILVLPEDAPVGQGLVEYLGLDDVLFEVDNKDVTHRADLWGLYGFARELAAIYQRPLRPLDLDGTLREDPAAFPIRLEDEAGCPRYLGLLMEGVSGEAASPDWLAQRLRAAGMRPINLLVDLSNYVMLETGQPTHPFDRDALKGGIVVRRARPGETLTTLDDVERKLTPDDLLIADEERGVAIAGVMGGAPTEVHAGTRRMLLESAAFEAVGIRRTASRLGLRTDAMARFEKFLDPTLPELAVRRYAALLRQLCPEATVHAGFAAAGRADPPSRSLTLRPDRVRTKLGFAVDDAEIQARLESVGFGVQAEGDCLRVAVPSWRAGRDVEQEDDLIEEVGRLAGYERAPATLPRMVYAPPAKDPVRVVERRATEVLVLECGYTETLGYSFVTERHRGLFHAPDEVFLTVRQPMTQDTARLRRSVVPGLLQHLADNQLHRKAVRLLEVGRAYLPEAGQEQPRERVELVAGRLAKDTDGTQELLEARSDAAAMLARLGLSAAGQRPGQAPAFCHPERCIEWVRGGQVLGYTGLVHPRLEAALELECPTALSWFDLGVLAAQPAEVVRMQPLPQFPSVWRDLSMVAPRDLQVADLEKEIRTGGQERVHRVELFDVYQGKGIPEGCRSLAFRLEYRHPDRTMTDVEVQQIQQRILKRLARKDVTLRG